MKERFLLAYALSKMNYSGSISVFSKMSCRQFLFFDTSVDYLAPPTRRPYLVRRSGLAACLDGCLGARPANRLYGTISV
jgi:hypothetical protein